MFWVLTLNFFRGIAALDNQIFAAPVVTSLHEFIIGSGRALHSFGAIFASGARCKPYKSPK
jgi:hypothetical protein